MLFKTASHTLIFRMKALSSCSMCDSNVSELFIRKPQNKTIVNNNNNNKIHILKSLFIEQRFFFKGRTQIHTWLTAMSVGKSQTQISLLDGDLCPWWLSPPFRLHSGKRFKQTFRVKRKIVFYSTRFSTRLHHYFLNERLHTVKSILNILVQLWVTGHLRKKKKEEAGWIKGDPPS